MDYKDEIIDHYKHPRNFGTIEEADVSIKEGNASCGDMIEVSAKLKNSKIQELKWRGIGCAISTAAASMLSEMVVGKTKEDLEKFGEKGILEMLGGEINAGRIKCATLSYKAMLKVFEN